MPKGLALVTGGSSGIGLATVKALSRLDYATVLTSRSQSRAEAAAAEIPQCQGMALDLSSMDSVRDFARAFQNQFESLDVLIHNAGACFPKRVETEDGFDAQLAIIYLGPYLLTELLWERLSSQARVVCVASDLHHAGRLNLQDFQSRQNYNFLRSYRQAELAKIMHCQSLARRPEAQGMKINSLHPGGVRSQLFRNFRPPLSWLIALSSLLKKSPEKGARTSVYLATAEGVRSGEYYVDCRVKRASELSSRLDLQERLEEHTREILGLN